MPSSVTLLVSCCGCFREIAYLFDGYIDGVRAGAKRLGRAKQRPVPRESLETYESVTYVQRPMYSVAFNPYFAPDRTLECLMNSLI
jgi:hypothetical protein